MSVLAVENLCVRAGDFHVRDVSFEIADREYFILMGTTGSGKSLVMKAVCGLLRPESGRIVMDGHDVTELEPRRRSVGYVPQESGLFPHMSVERNLMFPFEISGGLRRREARRRIAPIVEALGIEHLLGRSTFHLSGGERQKVALGRALGRKPTLLALDEPVSALDEPTRRDICEALRRACEEFGLAAIHVCHNLEEARLMSDRLGILFEGRLAQTGSLEGLARQPANEAVARLLGTSVP